MSPQNVRRPAFTEFGSLAGHGTAPTVQPKDFSTAAFERFIQHGRFLKNWSPKTIRSYRQAFSSFQNSLPEGRTGSHTKADLEAWVAWMRARGLSAGAS